jgi:hypothetical protein
VLVVGWMMSNVAFPGVALHVAFMIHGEDEMNIQTFTSTHLYFAYCDFELPLLMKVKTYNHQNRQPPHQIMFSYLSLFVSLSQSIFRMTSDFRNSPKPFFNTKADSDQECLMTCQMSCDLILGTLFLG